MDEKEAANLISKLDTERFGFPIARVNQWAALSPDDVCRDLKLHGIKLIITKVDATATKSLKAAGFEEMDAIIHYTRDLKGFEIQKPHHEKMSFRLAETDDQDVLASIAAASFMGGHYFNDKRLDPEISSQIYQDWIKRSCTGELANRVYLAEINRQIAGFATFELNEREEMQGLWAGIGATHANFRGMGVCRLTLQYGLSEYLEQRSYAHFGSAVSANNSSVKKVFEYLGCRPTEHFSVLHKWL